MREVCLCARQHRHFIVVKMYAVREHYVRAGDAERIKIRDVTHSGFALNHLAFVPVLGRVSMNHYAAFAGQLGNFAEQLPGATDRKSRRKTTANAAIAAPVPLVNQTE